ncbi:hypothetical protein O3M35_005098 [Rhynocoris fuscipes]|uniref:Uncharacterized protein n=1 Tax=Rhynocoris fuscipes TaxID=488301 RepID=A0AAW1DKR3_9HEMI
MKLKICRGLLIRQRTATLKECTNENRVDNNARYLNRRVLSEHDLRMLIRKLKGNQNLVHQTNCKDDFYASQEYYSSLQTLFVEPIKKHLLLLNSKELLKNCQLAANIALYSQMRPQVRWHTASAPTCFGSFALARVTVNHRLSIPPPFPNLCRS